jgi:hypothetical protein
LVVKGDLSGEGNVNTHDRDAFYKRLFGTQMLDELHEEAADRNDDGVADTLDLLLMEKQLV